MQERDLSSFHGRGYSCNGLFLVRLDGDSQPRFTPCSPSEYVAMGEKMERQEDKSNA